MKVKKKYIAYFTVLAIGGGWLTMDCLSGSIATESVAGAAVTTVDHDASSATPPAPAPLATDMGDEQAIAQRLADLDAERSLANKPITDAFALPSAFAPPAPPKPAVATAVTVSQNFARNHKLISVMVAGRLSSALVDGKTLLKIGDRLDGFTLTAVTMNSATFANTQGGKAVLAFREAPSSIATASVSGQ